MLTVFDGSNLLHKSLRVVGDSGDWPQALILFLQQISNSLERFVHSGSCSIFVCWDLGVPLFRRSLWRNYKPNKKPYSWNIKSLIPEESDFIDKGETLEDYLKYYKLYREVLNSRILCSIGITSICVPDIEADDLVAFLVRRYGKADDIIVFSTDKDLHQLLGDRVFQVCNSSGNLLSLQQFLVKEELSESRDWKREFILRKSIIGDKSDNIPRLVRGVGEKRVRGIAKDVLGSLDAEFPFGNYSEELHGFKKCDLARNYMLIDLDYPILAKRLGIIDFDIDQEILSFLLRYNVEKSDSWTVQDIISEYGIRSYKILSSIDTIADFAVVPKSY